MHKSHSDSTGALPPLINDAQTSPPMSTASSSSSLTPTSCLQRKMRSFVSSSTGEYRPSRHIRFPISTSDEPVLNSSTPSHRLPWDDAGQQTRRPASAARSEDGRVRLCSSETGDENLHTTSARKVSSRRNVARSLTGICSSSIVVCRADRVGISDGRHRQADALLLANSECANLPMSRSPIPKLSRQQGFSSDACALDDSKLSKSLLSADAADQNFCLWTRRNKHCVQELEPALSPGSTSPSTRIVATSSPPLGRDPRKVSQI